MGLKYDIALKREAQTTDATTWVNLVTIPMPGNGTASLQWEVVGRDTTSGEIATSNGTHRAKRVAGTLSMVGNIVTITTFNTGSDSAIRTSAARIEASGDNIILQVRGVSGKTIDWYGKLQALIN